MATWHTNLDVNLTEVCLIVSENGREVNIGIYLHMFIDPFADTAVQTRQFLQVLGVGGGILEPHVGARVALGGQTGRFSLGAKELR